MVECCIQHAIRRTVLLFMVLVLSIAASRTGRKAHHRVETGDVGGRGSYVLVLYVCTMTCEVLWSVTMLADVVKVDALHKAWTWAGVLLGALSVVLNLTELGVEYAPQDELFLQVRYAIAYLGVGLVYAQHAYRRLRPPRPPHPPHHHLGHAHGAGDDNHQQQELVEITLGG